MKKLFKKLVEGIGDESFVGCVVTVDMIYGKE